MRIRLWYSSMCGHDASSVGTKTDRHKIRIAHTQFSLGVGISWHLTILFYSVYEVNDSIIKLLFSMHLDATIFLYISISIHACFSKIYIHLSFLLRVF